MMRGTPWAYTFCGFVQHNLSKITTVFLNMQEENVTPRYIRVKHTLRNHSGHYEI